MSMEIIRFIFIVVETPLLIYLCVLVWKLSKKK